MLWRRCKGERPGPSGVVEMEVHTLDDRARVESLIAEARFDSWKVVTETIDGYGITGEEVRDIALHADPSAGEDAVAAFFWGVARALKARADDPPVACLWIADGLDDFCLPESLASAAGLAKQYSKLADLLLRRWTRVAAIVGSRIPADMIDGMAGLASRAGRLRGQAWTVIALCGDGEAAESLCENGDYLRAKVVFAPWVNGPRVASSSVVGRPAGSPPALYVASSVEEGIAVLDFEAVNLCIALSGPDAVTFAHPVVGAYCRRAFGGSRLVRAVAVEPLETVASDNNLMSRLSWYMVNMYAHLQVQGIATPAGEMEEKGFVRIGSIECIDAMMTLAHRVAAAVPRWGEYKTQP